MVGVVFSSGNGTASWQWDGEKWIALILSPHPAVVPATFNSCVPAPSGPEIGGVPV
jgi:hypothetical protein